MKIRDTLYVVLCTIATLILAIVALRYLTSFWLLSFVFSFQTHIGVACILLVLVCLVLKRHVYAFGLLAVALFLTGHSLIMAREFAAQAPPEETAGARTFRLLSFNVLFDNLQNTAAIADMIIASQADVAYVFEAGPLLPEMGRLATTYPYKIGCTDKDHCDLLLLSRRPFKRAWSESLSGLWDNRFAMAEIDLDGTPVKFATAHLTKPYFDDFHTSELQQLSYILQDNDGPLILAGDFNSSIIAPDMRRFLRHNGLKTAAFEPATWPVEAGKFGIAIDHVFARPPVTLTSVTRLSDNFGSNHYGLISEFLVRK